MKTFQGENLSHDPVHGYIRFVAQTGEDDTEICERHVIDHPWVQRMRQIRQLQTAWWVYPTAEHTRFQHILGVMHLASRAIDQLYGSLVEVDPSTPPKSDIDALVRMTGLLHDVGHGPFGHFFDAHFLSHFDLTHEKLGALIVRDELRDVLGGLRRSPVGDLTSGVDADSVGWLMQRPSSRDTVGKADSKPRWLELLQGLFCGIYTVDNMDFVLRDAFMTGLNPRSIDLQRLLHYSFFTPSGLTIHDRGMPALVHFLSMKAELFRSVYFHRTVRAIDLELTELFRDSRQHIFPGDPRDHLDEYLEFTEFTLLADAKRWHRSSDPQLAKLGQRWLAWTRRQARWVMACQRNVSFSEGQSEASSVFSSAKILSDCLRDRLPADLRNLEFRIDLARHIHRPHTQGATAGVNFYYDSASGKTKSLTTHGLYRMLPVSHTIVRVYTLEPNYQTVFSSILDDLVGAPAEDDLTNM